MFPDVDNASPWERHRIIGVNCFQHAVGRGRTVYLSIKQAPERNGQFAIYLALLPGNAPEEFLRRDITKKSEIEHVIIENLKLEGAISVQDISLNDHCNSLTNRVIALYTSSERGQNPADFHFIGHTGKQWESKVPFDEVKFYDTAPEIIDGYRRVSYFIFPKERMPAGLKKLTPKFLNSTEGASTTRLALIDSGSIMQCNEIYYQRDRNMALHLSSRLWLARPKFIAS